MSDHDSEDGEPLPPGSTVFRLAEMAMVFEHGTGLEGMILPAMFALSDAERQGSRRLSVYASPPTDPRRHWP